MITVKMIPVTIVPDRDVSGFIVTPHMTNADSDHNRVDALTIFGPIAAARQARRSGNR